MLEIRRTVNIGIGRFEVGDIVSVTLKYACRHEDVDAMAVKQAGENMIFCLVDCLRQEYPMNRIATIAGGYEGSDLFNTLRDKILPMFHEQLIEKMVPFDNGNLIRIPTEKEIFGTNDYGEDEPEDVTQWKPMKIHRNRIALLGSDGYPYWYWLQNPWLRDFASKTDFTYVNGKGNCGAYFASYASGVRPVFQIPNP